MSEQHWLLSCHSCDSTIGSRSMITHLKFVSVPTRDQARAL
jgi:hypothetical protein